MRNPYVACYGWSCNSARNAAHYRADRPRNRSASHRADTCAANPLARRSTRRQRQRRQGDQQ